MNKPQILLLLSIALSSTIIGCSDEANYKTMAEKYNTLQVEKAKHKAMSAEQMAAHTDEEMHHDMPMPTGSTEAHNIDTDEIGRNADDLPPPLNRKEPQLVRIDLYTEELVAEMMPEVTYQYWTYNGKVPGPFIRARAGDQVEIHLSHGKPGVAHQGHNEHTSGEHAAAGHSAHSLDLHAVSGPGGGAPLMQVGQGEEKSFRFKAMHPGIYVYHCASPHVPSHIANGMYGMILVEHRKVWQKLTASFMLSRAIFTRQVNSALKAFKRSAKKSCWRNSRTISCLTAGSTRSAATGL